MSHFGTHTHRGRQVFTSNKSECDLRLNWGPNCLPKRVTTKESAFDKPPLDSDNSNNKSTGGVYVKLPLHNKLGHVTKRFEVLTTHADTLDAVLDDTLTNTALQTGLVNNTQWIPKTQI